MTFLSCLRCLTRFVCLSSCIRVTQPLASARFLIAFFLLLPYVGTLHLIHYRQMKTTMTRTDDVHVIAALSVGSEDFDPDCPIQRTEERSDDDGRNDTIDAGECLCVGAVEIRCRGGVTALPDFRRTNFPGHPSTSGTSTSFIPIYREFDVSRQSLQLLPSAAFINLQVQKIILNFNPLEDRISGDAFLGMPDLMVELQMAGCGIRNLPSGLLDMLTELRYVHLWRNRLERIPVEAFGTAAAGIRDLIMWGNMIEELEEDSLVGMRHLRRLDLDKNRLSSIHLRAFANHRHLRSLHLADNNLKTLHDDMFDSLDNLRALTLDRNGLEYVYTYAFRGLQSLRSLSLADNRITFLPDEVFVSLRNLTVLQFNGNRLEHIWTRTFAGLASLRTLNLSGNRLCILPDGVLHDSPSLVRLSLDGNRLRTLRRYAVSREAKVEFVSLVDNPVVCDCRLAGWLRQIPVDNGLDYVDIFSDDEKDNDKIALNKVEDHDNDYRRRIAVSHPSSLRSSAQSERISATIWGTCSSRTLSARGSSDMKGGSVKSDLTEIGTEAGNSTLVESIKEDGRGGAKAGLEGWDGLGGSKRLMSIGNPAVYKQGLCISYHSIRRNECGD